MKTRRARLAVGLALALAPLFSACGEAGPDIGEAVDAEVEGCTLTDSDPATPVHWKDVKGVIFEKRCGCHMTPGGFGATVGGLLLADRASALKGGRHTKDGLAAITPGEPCASYILDKTGPTPPFGARMPLSANPLAGAERQLLIDWIAEGAEP